MAHLNVNSSPVYTHHPSPGVALIIVNENFQESEPRPAAYKDFQALTDTFTKLGFKIEPLCDGTNEDILTIIKKGNTELKYGFPDNNNQRNDVLVAVIRW